MDLKDLTDDKGLQQDEWSSTKIIFGEHSQLSVIGWSGRRIGNKFYILQCSICSQDPELFGQGYFRSTKGNLLNGRTPCGCSWNPKWSKEQLDILCSRKAMEIGHTFLGFEDEWKGVLTKIRMLCEKHGEWNSGIANDLLHKSQGCPTCGNRKPDEDMIQSFFDLGGFHPDTKFWRSDRKTAKGAKPYWYVYCPICEKQGEALGCSLRVGKRSCECSKHCQQEAYINLLADEENIVAIKFGISRNSSQRVKQQNASCIYETQQHSVYEFPDVASCKKAERECKKELETGVVLKRDMPDGWSETTYIYNLDKIKQIYTKHGGVEIWPSL